MTVVIIVIGTGSFKAVREGLLRPRPQLLGVHWRLCVPWFLAASPQFTAFRFMRRSPLTHLPLCPVLQETGHVGLRATPGRAHLNQSHAMTLFRNKVTF